MVVDHNDEVLVHDRLSRGEDFLHRNSHGREQILPENIEQV
jgi:hypothetical protein